MTMITNPGALIFLDLDGPMIPLTNTDKEYVIPTDEFPYNSKMSPEACRHIETLCKQFNAAVVTNSTHNNGHGSDREPTFHVFDLFEKNGISHLLLDGPYMTAWADIKAAGRKHAVERWLQAHPEYSDLPFVVFDDNAYNFGDMPDFPFVNTGEEGISENDIDLAAKHLNNQLTSR